MSRKTTYFGVTVLATVLVIFYFFGGILENPNRVYFAGNGDGFKSYYGAIYHLKYDKDYGQFKGMNYPYGESVFFTDNQPLLTNTVKFLDKLNLGVSSNIVGIVNLLMILSILIAVVFLYLIFIELGVTWWFASLAAIGISLLSPQIGRMGGHFSLSHVFWIPVMLYLILRFSRKQSWKLTLLISVVVFLAASMHLYFAGFYGLLLTFYWLFSENWLSKDWKKRGIALLHWFVQICLPVLFVQLIVALSDQATDRTTHPYGFLVYLAHPVSIFLPSGAPYGFVPKFVSVFRHLDWEAYAFIGVSALIGFLIGVYYFIRNIVLRKAFWKVSDQPTLNILFWASIVSLLLSFGIPFVFKMEWLLDYIGPFRQLRALSRFSWLFFYVINIFVFYRLYQWFQSRQNKIGTVVIVVAFLFLFIDGYFNVNGLAGRINNHKEILDDRKNELSANQWVKDVNPDQFQCILPIPYFHVGSENIWIDGGNNVVETTFIASLKTGLPTTAVMMGRTSISQTYRNYNLLLEPVHDYAVLDDFKNQKDILLLRMKKYQPNADEQRLLNSAALITGNDEFELLALPFETLKQIPEQYQKAVVEAFRSDSLFEKAGFLMSDTASFFYYNDFAKETGFLKEGAHPLNPIYWNTLLSQKLKKTKAGQDYLLSFWLKDFQRDAYPRFNIEISQMNDAGESVDYFYSDIHRYLRTIDGDWAMFEIPVHIKVDDVSVKISVRNTVLQHANYIIDDLMVHNSECDIFRKENGLLEKNTRKFKID